jgi:DNA-directed RNA polymerase specialized sigma24 family protein
MSESGSKAEQTTQRDQSTAETPSYRDPAYSLMIRTPRFPTVYAALKTLSKTDILKLNRWASRFMLAVRGKVHHSDAGDLVQEALLRTVDERREWNPKVDFLKHLRECMRSIANEWAKKGAREVPLSDAHPDGKNSNERDAQHIIETLQSWFDSYDAEAAAVFHSIREGYSAAAIQQRHNIDLKRYNAVRKRIARRLDMFRDSASATGEDNGERKK